MHLPEAESTRVRIALADRYVLVRQCLRRLLDDHPGFRVVGEASTARKTLALVEHFRPGVLVLGELADSGVLPFLQQLTNVQPGVRPVLLAHGMSRREFGDAVALGAWGIVPRESELDALLECLSCVQVGAHFVHQVAAAPPVAAPAPDPAVRTLTKRERELAIAVAGGSSNKEIADKLSISELTVKRRLVDVFSKLGVRSRVQLAMCALQNGLRPGEAETAPNRMSDPLTDENLLIAAEAESGH